MGISALISSNKPSCMTGTEVPVLARGINISQGYYSWLKDTTWTWKSPGKEGSASESKTGDNSNSNPFANAYNDLHEPSGQLETTITHWICPLPSTASITKYLLIACYFIRKWTSPLLQQLIFETEIKNIHILNWAKVFLMFMVFRSDQISRSVMSNSLRPHESQHARPPYPSPTPRAHPDSHPSSQWCHPAISSSVVPFSSCP